MSKNSAFFPVWENLAFCHDIPRGPGSSFCVYRNNKKLIQLSRSAFFIRSLPKIRLCMRVLMEYYDFKVFTRVLWQFMTKFAALTDVCRCAMCKQGWYTWKQLDTSESWHTLCLIFGRVGKYRTLHEQAGSDPKLLVIKIKYIEGERPGCKNQFYDYV